MKKNILIILSVVALVGLIVSSYLLLEKKKSYIFSDPLYAIPEDAGLILKIKAFDKVSESLLYESRVWESFGDMENIRKINHSLQFIDSLSLGNKHLKQNLKNIPLYISAHPVGRDHFGFIYYKPLGGGMGEKQLLQIIHQLLKDKGDLKERKYENTKVYDVTFKRDGRSENYSFTIQKGLFIGSVSSILLEDAIRQLNLSEPESVLSGFLEVSETEGKSAEAALYINVPKLKPILETLASNSLSRSIADISSPEAWTEMDLSIKKDHIQGFGFTAPGKMTDNIFRLFRNQDPVKATAESVLPANTASFVVFAFSNPGEFKKQYMSLISENGRINEYINKLDQINGNKKYNVEEMVYDNWEGEIISARVTGTKDRGQLDPLLLMKMKSKSIMEEKLLQILKKEAAKKGVSASKNIRSYSIDEAIQFKIYKNPFPQLFDVLFSEIISFPNANYYTFFNNYIVLGETFETLSAFLHTNALRKNLESHIEYKSYSELITSKYNLYYYMDVYSSASTMHHLLSRELYNGFEKYAEVFEKTNKFAIQLANTHDLIYTNIIVKRFRDLYIEPITDWETYLDNEIQFKPKLVINHYTNDKEIFIQDLKYQIYLINKQGVILWKLPLNEQINSDVFQVDRYQNGKLQYLFSTQNYLHLIDRNGNYVERYPVKLKSSSAAGMNLVDYDNNKNYRIFIPCIDKNIYLYSIEGNIIPGWDFSGADHQVLNPVQHFRVDTRDYLVFADKYKTYILDRKGTPRVTPEEQIAKSVNNLFYLDNDDGSENPALVTTDSTGNICYLYFDGKVKIYNLNKYSSDHFFELNDMNGDNMNDYIFADKNILEVFDHNRQSTFKQKFEREITLQPLYFHFSQNDRKLGITIPEENRIYLINNDGNIYEGFPLKGHTPFTIGRLKSNSTQFNLLVGGDDKFLFNYSVN